MTILQTKICNKCKRELPATSEYFHKMKGGLYGIRTTCKDCLRSERKLLSSTQEYKEKHNLRAKKWKENNPEKVKELQKTFWLRNKDRLNALRAEKYKSDPEYKERKKARDKLRKRNKEQFSPENWEKELAKRRKYKKNLSEEAQKNVKLCLERFLKNNPGYQSQKDKERKLELHDSYIVGILHEQTDIDSEHLYKAKELLDLKRNQIKLFREVKKHGN
jgi:hypothetical protein